MPKIHLLDDRLISQIAAGEVVERPASVVKELVENALDAGARSVEVELEAGGKRRIVVIDDGGGMGGDDALLAFDRHATSKIRSYQDLERVATLGFRGEALASIAAVSRVELQTAEEPGDGQRVRVEAGRILGVEPISFPRGTRIEVASLFFSVPARRKFLKSPETELRRCLEVVQGYTLAHPECRFTLKHEGKLLLEADQAPGEDGARERIAQIFGRDLARRLHEIPLEFVGEREAIWGYVGDKETSRGRRNFLFVNRRLVRDRILAARFYGAVRQEWHSDEFPSLFLFLELEPEQLDVNVHPQKHEVRFRSDAFVDRVEAALRQTLALARGEETAYLRAPRSLPQMPAAWEGLGGRFDRSYSPPPGPLFGAGRQAGEVGEPRTPYDPAWRGAGQDRKDRSYPTDSSDSHSSDSHSSDALPPSPPPSIARPSYPPLVPSNVPLSGRGRGPTAFRLLGQYKGSLVLLEGHDGLYLVDQHAAHERILYERLRRSFAAQAPQSQVLLSPILLELAPAEALRLEQLAPALLACGFEVAPLSGGTVALRAAPDTLGLDQAELLVRRLATADGDADGEEEGGAAGVARLILEELAAERSCKAAIKIHRVMGAAEMEALVSELFACEQPYACPHGRPTVLYLGDAELERRFGRRG